MNKDEWKYSKKRLSKHEFCTAIINHKKVICICEKKVKLNRKWDEDYFNRHANGNGYKRKIGQQTILYFFNTTNFDESGDISSEEEYNSDICDNMDDDDIITVDSNDNNNNDLDNILSSEDENIQLTIKNTKKRISCPGLRSQKIHYYIERIPAQVSGYCIRAKNCNGEYINDNLCIECKQLKSNIKLDNCIRAKKPDKKNLKFTPNWYFENDKLKKHLRNSDLATIWNIIKDKDTTKDSNLWITIANKDLNGTFDNVDTFKGLCAVMCQVINCKEEGKEIRNLQYSEEFTNFLIVLHQEILIGVIFRNYYKT
ncbi:hypothetical protein Glove_272g25 [Diversispora epigaea]|uniref:Uncharacterized protein n=1 Tax=Diversispora epigaea TaxID=1348612 RepID=A0A397I5C7_9GLOM|nr:hypothetical protein Glove_272g25 [Diversispora epigaea]